jgi:lipid-binding SYLF domain-containing protein
MEVIMKAPFFTTLAVFTLLPLSSAWSAPRDRSTVEDAIDTLDELAKVPEKCMPPALMRNAHAVIIAPNVIKGGLVVAARHGHGVLLVREQDGSWSNPVFVKITGGRVGFQIGVQATDLFLVFRDRKSLERLMRGAGKLTLGADASVAAGPLCRGASADTDALLRADILTYSRTRGIFAGVALEGDTLRIDWPANEKFYNQRDLTVPEVLSGKVGTPEPAAALRATLARWPEKIEMKRPTTLELPRIP